MGKILEIHGLQKCVFLLLQLPLLNWEAAATKDDGAQETQHLGGPCDLFSPIEYEWK